MSSPRLFAIVLAILCASCVSNSTTGLQGPEVAAQNARIRAEPAGDYYVGRRYVTKKTRFWGYLRRPKQPWSSSKLVVMNESLAATPDRLPERPDGADRSFGFDHNHEYRIWGSYSGKKIYDPNSNLFLPEFVLEEYELVNADPGFLFDPKEKYDPKLLPARRY